jgi:hypothetical protein
MRMGATMYKADWRATVSRAVGILVLLSAVLLATRLCVANTQPDKPVVCTIDSHTSCELEVQR